jgi:hypothetical protein
LPPLLRSTCSGRTGILPHRELGNFLSRVFTPGIAKRFDPIGCHWADRRQTAFEEFTPDKSARVY